MIVFALAASNLWAQSTIVDVAVPPGVPAGLALTVRSGVLTRSALVPSTADTLLLYSDA